MSVFYIKLSLRGVKRRGNLKFTGYLRLLRPLGLDTAFGLLDQRGLAMTLLNKNFRVKPSEVFIYQLPTYQPIPISNSSLLCSMVTSNTIKLFRTGEYSV
jgi:hypothetical protein